MVKHSAGFLLSFMTRTSPEANPINTLLAAVLQQVSQLAPSDSPPSCSEFVNITVGNKLGRSWTGGPRVRTPLPQLYDDNDIIDL